MAEQDPSLCTIMVRGDMVAFEMEDGSTLEFKKGVGLIHDVAGMCMDRCDIRVGKCNTGRRKVQRLDARVEAAARNYFGNDAELRDGTVEVPQGPWKYVGRVTRIYYRRYGQLKGLYQHPFEQPIPLYESVQGDGYRLRLPKRCVVDEHGFVWP